jgi:hypothetical protein
MDIFCVLTSVIFSRSAQEHTQRLEDVLQLHPGRYDFLQPRVQYLDYVLSENGVTASADKVKAEGKYRTPKNVKDVGAFLGLASFYRRLVPNFAEAAMPLTSSTRKN